MANKSYWENLVSDKDLIKAKNDRKKEYIFDRTPIALRNEAESEGWDFVSEYKDGKTIKIQKRKDIGELFENKVWLMLQSMGYTVMNKDNSFVIAYGKEDDSLTKQIDVYAEDDETIVCVECKASETPATKRDFKTEIESFNGIRQGLINNIHKTRGKDKKIKFLWATSNIELSDLDSKRLDDAGIVYFDEDAIEYYFGLSKHLGSASKYQFLGYIFKKTTIKGMPQTVPAIRGKMGGHTYYSFSIEPERLLKIGYVLHRSDANKGMMPTYQRIVKKSRLKSIRKFVNSGGFFPNSVIISIDSNKKNKKLRFDVVNTDTDSDTQVGVLYLPQSYSSAYIIDGQHRLYGYSDTAYSESNTIPVVAFENLDQREQVRLFMEINENQQAVPKNLRNTLNADMLWEDEDYNERRKALRLRIAEVLGENPRSPLYDRIIIGENDKSDTRCITMEAVDKGLREGRFVTRFVDNEPVSIGLLDNTSKDNEYAFKTINKFLVDSFSYFKENLNSEWMLGKEAQGILTINTGIYALLRIFSDIVEYLTENNYCNHKKDGTDKLIEYCRPFFDAVVDFYLNIDDELREEIKKAYGDGGSTKHWRYLQKAVHDRFPDDFNPSGLDDWWADNSKEFNQKAEEYLSKIFKATKTAVEYGLVELNGPEWRRNGIPTPIVLRYATDVTKKNLDLDDPENKIDTWDLVSLKDLGEIALAGSNWSDYFKDRLTRPEEIDKKGDKKKKTKWIEDMEKYSKRLKKPGTSISRSEFEYIQSIYQWLVTDLDSGNIDPEYTLLEVED